MLTRSINKKSIKKDLTDQESAPKTSIFKDR